jgi:hypothetical protein
MLLACLFQAGRSGISLHDLKILVQPQLLGKRFAQRIVIINHQDGLSRHGQAVSRNYYCSKRCWHYHIGYSPACAIVQ